MKIIYSLCILISPILGFSQNIGIGTVPNGSAMLDISSTNKGLLIPRLTTSQRTTTIASPAAGLLVYDTDTKGFWYYSGSAWITLESSENKLKRIYIPAKGMSYTPSASIVESQWGPNLSNTAGYVSFVIPKPLDLDSTKTFSITLHFSLPTNLTNTFIQWRLNAGANRVNVDAASASTGWDSYNYWTTEDAALLVSYASSYTTLSKSQTWTAKYSSVYNTWYFGAVGSVTVANDFTSYANSMWHFGFLRGTAVPNGETYSGNITVNGATIIYTSK